MIDIRQEARADIDEIAEYGVLQFGEAASVSYERGLIALTISLRAEPGMGRSEAFGNGVRSFPYKAHRIYYYFENEKLTILRVLSPRQPLPGQL
jgi:plasmid stabilization system protein ParE